MINNKNSKSTNSQDAPEKALEQRKPAFHIAAIGASAGGLDPLKKIFSNVKPDSGITWVAVSHLDPLHATILPEADSPSPKKKIANRDKAFHFRAERVGTKQQINGVSSYGWNGIR